MATVSHVEPRRRDRCDVQPGPTRHRLTVDEYYRMAEAGILGRGARVELIDGEIIDMPPIGVLHAAVVNVLVRHFAQHLGASTFVSGWRGIARLARAALGQTRYVTEEQGEEQVPFAFSPLGYRARGRA